MQQRAIIQPQLNLLERKHRAVGLLNTPNVNIVRHQSPGKTQTQMGKFQFNSVCAKRFDERSLQKIRQSDFVEP